MLSKHKILGWIAKIVGGTAWIVFLFQNNNLIFMAVTVVIVLTMIYGFYKWKIGPFVESIIVVAEILGTVLLARKKNGRLVFIHCHEFFGGNFSNLYQSKSGNYTWHFRDGFYLFLYQRSQEFFQK